VKTETGNKICVTCGKEFSRRYREAIGTFNKRKTCGGECALKAKRNFRDERPAIPTLAEREAVARAVLDDIVPKDR
jgi:hypothetical protein